MAHYYCREDGSAANIAASTGVAGQAVGSIAAAADASKCATVAKINTGTGLQAGDTVWFSSQGGAFASQRLQPTVSGVTYRAITGETPTFTTAQGVISRGVSTVVYDGLTCNANSTGGAIQVDTTAVSAITLRNCTLTNAGAGDGFRSTIGVTGLTIENCSISSTSAYAIGIYTSAISDLSLTNVTLSSPKGSRFDRVTNTTIRRLIVTAGPTTNNGESSIAFNGCAGTLAWNGGSLTGQGVNSNAPVIFIGAGSTGQYSTFTNGLIQDVVLTNTLRTGIVTDGLPVTNSLTLRRVRVFGGTGGVGAGFYIGGNTGSQNVTLDRCEAWFCGDDGFDIAGAGSTGANNLQVLRCIAGFCGVKSSTESGDGFSSHGDATNIVYDSCLAVGNKFSGFHHVESCSGIIRNCTLIGNGDASGTPSSEGNMECSSTGRWDVINTIFKGGYPVDIQTYSVANVVTKNCVFDSTGATPIKYDGNAKTVAQWKAICSDTTSVQGSAGLDANFAPSSTGAARVGMGAPTQRSIGSLDLYGRPKLRADADCIGAVYPQRDDERNVLQPVMQFSGEAV